MKILSRSVILFFILGCSLTPKKPAEQTANSAPPAATVKAYLTDIRQLTFQGARAGESYFSHDGHYMIFQSEREKENPFYQIYLMDMQTGTTKRISPGQGKTTCSWISPDNKHILFA